MKKQLIAVFIAIVTIILFLITSCSSDNSSTTIGEDWVSSGIKVFFIDTMTVRTSTFKFDSIVTSNTSRLLVGAYNDPVFGSIKSKSYMQLDNSVYSLDDEAIYDSIALILKYDRYFYNDTIPIQKFNVYEVLQDIKEDEDNYYNTTNFEVNTLPIASHEFSPKPKKVDSLHISINHAFGETLFNKLRDNDINNIDEFLKEYKGLLVEPDESNTTVLGFSKDSFLRIYYSIKEEAENIEETIDFPFVAQNSFHNIANNFQGTYFETIDNQETYLASFDIDDSSFIQAGTGLVTRIDIPYIERIYDIDGSGTILNADLKITLKQSANTETRFTRDSLSVFIIDQKSGVISRLVNRTGEETIGIISDSDENSEFNIINYTFPVEFFLDIKLNEFNAENYFLAIYSQEFDQSVDRYIFNGEQANNGLKAKLEITYAVFDD